MSLKALPKERAERWIAAQCDPDGDVRFLIAPLSNTLMTTIVGSTPIRGGRRSAIADSGYSMIALVRAGLKGLEGVIDEDTGEDLKLVFVKERVGGSKKIEVIRPDIYDRIPPELVGEILDAVREGTEFAADEEENADFTTRSSTSTSPDASDATETSKPVDTDPGQQA